MANKYRYQNPAVGDTIILGLDVYNSNNFADVASIDHVDILFLDPTARTDANPDGRTLVTTIDGSLVTQDDTGRYHITLVTSPPKFVIGNYLDVWYAQFRSDDPIGNVEQTFSIYPDLWITSPVPIVYDFQFRFSPTRWRKGEAKYLQCEINPLVPRQSDLVRYYANLAIAADITISIEQHCGECVPCEEDLRLIVDDDAMTYKEKGLAFYRLDTTDLNCGIYNVWCKLSFADNVYISEKQQIQIFE